MCGIYGGQVANIFVSMLKENQTAKGHLEANDAVKLPVSAVPLVRLSKSPQRGMEKTSYLALYCLNNSNASKTK